MKLRVHAGSPQRAFSRQNRSKMARDFARFGFLITQRPLTNAFIADLVHALEDEKRTPCPAAQPADFEDGAAQGESS